MVSTATHQLDGPNQKGLDVEIAIGQTATAIVTKAARQRQEYAGTGDKRQVVGRLSDDQGRPLSGAAVLLATGTVGLISDATVLVPDVQAEQLVEGAVVALSGTMSARIVGGDYGAVRSTVTGVESVQQVGEIVSVLANTVRGASK